MNLIPCPLQLAIATRIASNKRKLNSEAGHGPNSDAPPGQGVPVVPALPLVPIVPVALGPVRSVEPSRREDATTAPGQPSPIEPNMPQPSDDLLISEFDLLATEICKLGSSPAHEGLESSSEAGSDLSIWPFYGE